MDHYVVGVLLRVFVASGARRVGDARRIQIAGISRSEASEIVRAYHYSGEPRAQSHTHLGVTLDGRLLGALQWGSPIDPRMVIGLVDGTRWGGMIELHRMAFSPELPRNSESRALGMCARAIRRHAPWIEWLLTYADGGRSGTGVIYRAAGWLLTGITRGSTFWRCPDGSVVSAFGLWASPAVRARWGIVSRRTQDLLAAGLTPMTCSQYRYVLPLQPGVRERLTVPVLPYEMARADSM